MFGGICSACNGGHRKTRPPSAPYCDRGPDSASNAVLRGRSGRALFVQCNPGAGGRYAHEVNALLEKARPDMFRAATTRDFWKGGASPGHADIEIYFYTY